MSRDMCQHGYNLREQFCADCASPDALRAEVDALRARLAEPGCGEACPVAARLRESVAQLAAERDGAYMVRDEMKLQRDEARAQRNTAQADAEADNAEAIRSRAERDEARAEVERLRDLFNRAIRHAEAGHQNAARLREALRWARDRVCERHDGLDLSLIDAALAGEGP